MMKKVIVLLALIAITFAVELQMNSLVVPRAANMVCSDFSTAEQNGASKPVITASYTNSALTITVEVAKSTADGDPTAPKVFYRIGATDADVTSCIATGPSSLAAINGKQWQDISLGGTCTAKYSITQQLSDVYATTGNPFTFSLGNDNRELTHSLPLFVTYSVNKDSECQYVSYQSTVSFKSILTVDANSGDFTSLEKEASFSLSGIRIVKDSGVTYFEVQGKVKPLLASTTVNNFKFSDGGLNTFTNTGASSCADSSTGCAVTFRIVYSTLAGVKTDITGTYKYTFDLVQSGVTTRTNINIDLPIKYAVPDSPSVTGDSASSTITLHTDNQLTTLRNSAYKPSEATIYAKNTISTDLPTGYSLVYNKGYMCCVEYGTSFGTYSAANDQGGCADKTGKIAQNSLGIPGTLAVGVSMITDVAKPKQYGLSISMNDFLPALKNSAKPLSCQILLISRYNGGTKRIVQTIDLNGNVAGSAMLQFEAGKAAASSAGKVFGSFGAVVVAVVVALLL